MRVKLRVGCRAERPDHAPATAEIRRAGGTVASGLVLVVKPESVSGFTGLAPDAARGVTAVRAAMGGLFIALGLTPLFEANLALRQRPLSGRNLNLALLRYPILTARVAKAIYWQALRLWFKRVPSVPHPGR